MVDSNAASPAQPSAPRETYLEAIVEMQRRLLLALDGVLGQGLNRALEPLARACCASRVYLFENHHDGDQLLMSQRAEWCAPGIPPEIDNPELQSLSYDDFFPRWAEAMQRGDRIQGEVATFPVAERTILDSQGILSILVIPLMVDGAFTGFIGFDHCAQVHGWTRDEIHLLEAAASNLSLLLAQRRSQQALASAHADLIAARDAAVAANRAKNTFMAKISHELRTPMNAILGYSEILLDLGVDEAPGLQEHLPDVRAIHTSGQHLLSIIDDLLDLSRAEAGEVRLGLSTFRLGQLVDQTERLLPVLASRSPQLAYAIHRPEGDLGMMRSDAVRLRQVLINLLSNAFKYTLDGRVDFRIDCSDPATVRFEIRDTGQGIAPEHQALIFEPFSQVQGQPGTLREGTGLGLAVSHHLCQLLGAELTLDSDLGRGSVFTLTCPRDAPRQAEPAPSQAAEP